MQPVASKSTSALPSSSDLPMPPLLSDDEIQALEERTPATGLRRTKSSDNLRASPGSVDACLSRSPRLEDQRALYLNLSKPLTVKEEKSTAGFLNRKFIDENSQYQDPIRSFLNRKGAFGYQEVFNFCDSILSPMNKKLLENTGVAMSYSEAILLLKIQELVGKNLLFLKIQLLLLKRVLGPQLAIFREALHEFAKIDQKANPRSICPIPERVSRLKEEITNVNRVVRENIENLMPFVKICASIENGNIQGLTLTDFEGELVVQIPNEWKFDQDIMNKCRLLRELYLNYMDSILDSHRWYGAKFLTAINEFQHYVESENRLSAGRVKGVEKN